MPHCRAAVGWGPDQCALFPSAPLPPRFLAFTKARSAAELASPEEAAEIRSELESALRAALEAAAAKKAAAVAPMEEEAAAAAPAGDGGDTAMGDASPQPQQQPQPQEQPAGEGEGEAAAEGGAGAGAAAPAAPAAPVPEISDADIKKQWLARREASYKAAKEELARRCVRPSGWASRQGGAVCMRGQTCRPGGLQLTGPRHWGGGGLWGRQTEPQRPAILFSPRPGCLCFKRVPCFARSCRQPFESALRRPYFHVKPLDLAQLAAWGRYLDYSEALGAEAEASTVRLYERCLVACASYPGEGGRVHA